MPWMRSFSFSHPRWKTIFWSGRTLAVPAWRPMKSMSFSGLAEEVAGAADVHVVGRQREAGTERVEGLHDLEPALRGRRQHLVRRQGHVGIGPDLGAPDAAAELVELGQAEHVGAVDDQGVGG